jgi:hypothetical protein
MMHCLLLLFNSRQMKENPTPAELNDEKTPGQEPGKIIIIWLWWA